MGGIAPSPISAFFHCAWAFKRGGEKAERGSARADSLIKIERSEFETRGFLISD